MADTPSSERYQSLEVFGPTVNNDPIQDVAKGAQSMDINAVVNTAAVVILALAVLSKLATVDYGMMRGWSAAEIAYRIPIDNWMIYSAVLHKAPIITKAVTSATVYTIGDFVSQRTGGKSIGEIDRMRVLRSLIAGLIGHGPMSHVWYNVSENLFDNILHLTAWWSFIPKVVLDQTTW